jgi:transposase
MRTIGIDLALKADHRAIIMDERGRFLTPVLKISTRAADLDRLLARAREGAPRCKLQAVMEPTGMAWFPVAVYLIRHGVTVYLVNSQQVADLRRYYHHHAKSDRIDTRVLAKLPLHDPETLHELQLAGAIALACQRGCTQADRWGHQIAAIKNRFKATARFAWPGIETVFADLYAVEARWFAEHWFDPQAVLQAGVAQLLLAWQESGLKPGDSGAWVPALVALAQEVLRLYGPKSVYVDFELLQAEVQRELALLAYLEAQQDTLRLKTVRPLYRQLQPERFLETIPGVGQESAAVYASFVGHASRFDSARLFRGWSGMVPNSKESAEVESKGLQINHAGPRLIKKYAFLDAEVARRWDPQVAAIYYDQMVTKGKHHNQAICACATHVLDRVFVVLRDHKPYELRDVDGQPITGDKARTLIAEKYTVSDEVRQRTTKRYRQAHRDQRAEKKQKREEARTGVRSKP